MFGNGDLTLLVAIAAGVISFLSPCVLPLVPGYLGQLTAVATAGQAAGLAPSRWTALRHAIAYVAGFGTVFTILGLTATYVGGALFDWLPGLRWWGGLILIVLGLNLAGILTIRTLQRVWRPLEGGAARSVASASGTVAFQTAGGNLDGRPSRVERLGGLIVTSRGGWLASFGLGAIFAVGWTPCIGTILGGILGLASSSATAFQGGVLLAGYTLGLGVPFLLVGVLYDRAPAVLRPLVRHGRTVSLVGGLMVSAIGVAMMMDWLSLLPRYFKFLSGV